MSGFPCFVRGTNGLVVLSCEREPASKTELDSSAGDGSCEDLGVSRRASKIESKSDCREMEDASVLLLLSPALGETWNETGGGGVAVGFVVSFRPDRSNLVNRSTSYCGSLVSLPISDPVGRPLVSSDRAAER